MMNVILQNLFLTFSQKLLNADENFCKKSILIKKFHHKLSVVGIAPNNYF